MKRRTCRVVLWLAAIAWVVPITASAQHQTLTGILETEHFAVYYRPSSRAGASVERSAAMAERDLETICRRLGIKSGGRFKLFLYDDLEELAELSGVKGTGGFSAGDASHVPYDNDQTRFHELVHIIAYNRLRKAGDEKRNLFFAEGLANACLRFVHGIPVHAVAAYYRKREALPELGEITGTADFYAWLGAHPGFNAYDVGGSYFLFLLDTYGAKKTVRYYMGMSARRAFGIGVKALEKRWHKALDAFALRPEVESLLDQRHGGGLAFAKPAKKGLPAEILGRDSDWTSLAGEKLDPLDDAQWSWKKGVLTGSNEKATWSICELGKKKYGDCVIRAKIITEKPSPIQIRLGRGNQAMLVNGTFLYRGDSSVAHSPLASMHGGRRETDFVLVRKKGTIDIWIDGVKAVSTPADDAPTRVGVGFHQGKVSFEDLRVRVLR